MYDIVLTADESCMLNHEITFMGGFLSCMPRDRVPWLFRNYIERKIFKEADTKDGISKLALLSLRRVESCALEEGFNVVVCNPRSIHKFKAKIFGVYAMDPLGVGPATTTMTSLSEGREPYNKYYFERLVKNIKKNNPKSKIILGGPAGWQFKLFPAEAKRLKIDCIFSGEIENSAKELFTKALNGNLPKTFYGMPATNIPTIKNPCFWGMTEISRGCDRMCQFCDPSMKKFRWFGYDFIMKETEVNAKGINSSVCLLSEDVLRYGTRPGEWKPNKKVVKLVKTINKIAKKNKKSLSFTHCSLAAAASAPTIVSQISEELGLGKKKLIGVQIGLETGSTKLIDIYMRNKAKPFNSKDWCDVAERGFQVLDENNIIPFATLVVGLEKETDDDILKTIELVERLKDYRSIILPLFFVPLGILKKRKFFNARGLSEVQKDLLIECAKHTTRWGRKFSSWASESISGLDRFVMHMGGMTLLEALNYLKRREEFDILKLFKLLSKEVFNYFIHKSNY